MPSSATTRNRFEKQGAGENANAWGTKLNAAVFDLLDEALDGRTAFALSGSRTLTAANFAADEARRRVLDVTGGSGGTITIPAAEKLYLLRNASSGNVVVTSGSGAAATIGAGLMAIMFCDGSNVRVDGSAASASTSATQAAASAAAAAASAAAAAASETAAETAEINAETAETASQTAAAASSASASAASASATGATASASAASTSATNAAASASAAAASAAAAATAEANAETAETNAENAQAAAEAARDAAEGHAASVNPANLMHLTGAESAAGLKTFSSGIAINGQVLDGLSASGAALVEAASYAAMRALLDLEPGSDVQAWDALLDSIAALSLSGNGGRVLAVNSGATAFELVTPSGGWTQIAQVATTSGSTVDFTNISADYAELSLVFEGVSGSSNSNITLAVSSDGTSFGASGTLKVSLTSGNVSDGVIDLPNVRRNVGRGTAYLTTTAVSSPNADGNPGTPLNLIWRAIGGIAGLRVGLTAGSFDAGTITLFGI